jgi:hypothetical protein
MICENHIKGELACLKVELRAIEKGYIVSKPNIECMRYDRIIDCNGKLYRVQIKYTSHKQSSGSFVVDLRKITKSGKTLLYNKDEIDAILVYIYEIDKICWFNSDMFDNKKSITIRTELAKNNQMKKIIYYKDYLW